MEQIYNQLQTIFDDFFIDSVQVTPDLHAAQVPEWDSLAHISLIVSIEKKFGIRFKSGEVEGTKNVGDLASIIATKI